MCDFENLAVMIGRSQYQRDESEMIIKVSLDGRNHETLIDHSSNDNSNSSEKEVRVYTMNVQSTSEIGSNSNLNHLTGEVERRIRQENNC